MPFVPRCPASWPAQWWNCVPYRYGFDLYHFGYFWEAHEVWEDAWKTLPPEAPERALVQGLIFLTACCLKIYCGNGRGATRHCRMALARLQSLETDGRMMGIDVVDLAMRLQRLYGALDLDPMHLDNHLQLAPFIVLQMPEVA